MSSSHMYEGDFPFQSNDSLDIQITDSIVRGDFHLSIISLLILVIWTIYVIFFNSRVLGLIVSVLVRKFVKKFYIKFGMFLFLMIFKVLFLFRFWVVNLC